MLGRLKRVFGGRRRSPDEERIAALRAAGDAARTARRYGAAAALYEQMRALVPGDRDIAIQCGHLRKEAGDRAAAEGHYLAAWALRPDDSELASHIAHFYKSIGRREDAAAWFRRGPAPESELTALKATAPDGDDGLIAALAPGVLAVAPPGPDRIELRRLVRSAQDGQRMLSGVEAIRGFVVCSLPTVALRIALDGNILHEEELRRVETPHPTHPDRHGKHVFNVWLDFSTIAPGAHMIELRSVDADGVVILRREPVFVAPARPRPGSDAWVAIDPADPRSIEAQVRALPSVVRPAARNLFPDGVKNVLAMRTDQLGDLVASIPALQRLRALLPEARIVGLLTEANAALGRTLGLFDEIVVIDFPDDWIERRRLMPLAAQAALRDRLAGYGFDIAIDLAASDVSRDLLRLSGAKYLHGFGTQWPFLDGRFEFARPDMRTGVETMPHSAKVLALVEALGAALEPAMPVMRRADLTPATLDGFGLTPEDRYIVLHAGARLAAFRWPGFAALAEALLARTDRRIVLIGDDLPAGLPPEAARLLAIDRQLDFDQLDALLSYAALMIGNDSGPKHLAALRGTPVITLFSARIGWGEWGQERSGSIISRRVPCAGCAIRHDPDECGKDFACVRDIGVEEVLAEALRLCGGS